MMAEGEYVKAKTSIWWDIENCQVPKGWDANGIAQKLNSELTKMNYFGPLSISSYGNTDLIPDSVQQALSSTGISLNHVPSGRKDASDKKILVDMFLWVLDNPPPANIMLISGDGDFSYALHRLRMLRYNIILAHTSNAPASLVSSAKTSWLWRGLVTSGCCIFTKDESETSSEDVVSADNVPMDIGFGSRTSSSDAADKPKGVCVPEEVSNQILQPKKTRNRPPKKYRSAWCCQVCNVACQSLETYTTHMQSEEHRAHRELQQKSLGLLGPNPSECHEKDKVGEAGLEASSHCGFYNVVKMQTEAQESMKCLEKQNKEPMETSSSSESHGVDCVVVSELSRDCRVPEEISGECFDAILEKPEPSLNNIGIEKLESMLKQGLEMKSGEPEDALTGQTENLEEDMNKEKKKKKNRKKKNGEDGGDEPYFCSLCNVITHWPDDFESHLNGRKHTAKIKRLIEALRDNKQIQDIDQPKEMKKEVLFTPIDALENIDDGLEKKQNKEMSGICAISGKSVEELFQNFQQVLESENKSLPNPNEDCIFTELNPALSAPKEARKLDFAHGTNSGDPESNSAGAIERPPAEKKKEDKLSKDEAYAYACSMCNVKCHTQIVFKSHLMGRKHVAKVKRLAEVS